MGGTGSPLNANQIAGIVTRNKGTAVARLNGKSRLLAKNSPICIGETIVTANAAMISIRLSDNGLIELQANSRLRIDKFILGKKTGNASQFALLAGTSRFVTGRIGKANPKNVLVRTPDALVGVHGTDHVVTVIPQNSNGEYPAGTYDLVNSGVTFLRTEAGEIDIHPDQVGFAANGNDPPTILHDIPGFYHLTLPALMHDGGIGAGTPGHKEDIPSTELHPELNDEHHEYSNPSDSLPSISELPEVDDIPDPSDLPDFSEPPEYPQVPHEIED